MQVHKWVSSICVALVMACVNAGPPPNVLGQWGGDNIRLTIDALGGRIDYECGAGTIDTSIQLDPQNRFKANGKHDDFSASKAGGSGPTDADAVPSIRGARYSGKVDGNQMSLTVQVDGDNAVRSFTLIRGKSVKLIRCL